MFLRSWQQKVSPAIYWTLCSRSTDRNSLNSNLQWLMHHQCMGRWARIQRWCIPLLTSHSRHQSKIQWRDCGKNYRNQYHRILELLEQQRARQREQVKKGECWESSWQLGVRVSDCCSAVLLYTLEVIHIAKSEVAKAVTLWTQVSREWSPIRQCGKVLEGSRRLTGKIDPSLNYWKPWNSESGRPDKNFSKVSRWIIVRLFQSNLESSSSADNPDQNSTEKCYRWAETCETRPDSWSTKPTG